MYRISKIMLSPALEIFSSGSSRVRLNITYENSKYMLDDNTTCIAKIRMRDYKKIDSFVCIRGNITKNSAEVVLDFVDQYWTDLNCTLWQDTPGVYTNNCLNKVTPDITTYYALVLKNNSADYVDSAIIEVIGAGYNKLYISIVLIVIFFCTLMFV